jgi:hypothetical protein
MKTFLAFFLLFCVCTIIVGGVKLYFLAIENHNYWLALVLLLLGGMGVGNACKKWEEMD